MQVQQQQRSPMIVNPGMISPDIRNPAIEQPDEYDAQQQYVQLAAQPGGEKFQRGGTGFFGQQIEVKDIFEGLSAGDYAKKLKAKLR